MLLLLLAGARIPDGVRAYGNTSYSDVTGALGGTSAIASTAITLAQQTGAASGASGVTGADGSLTGLADGVTTEE